MVTASSALMQLCVPLLEAHTPLLSHMDTRPEARSTSTEPVLFPWPEEKDFDRQKSRAPPGRCLRCRPLLYYSVKLQSPTTTQDPCASRRVFPQAAHKFLGTQSSVPASQSGSSSPSIPRSPPGAPRPSPSPPLLTRGPRGAEDERPVPLEGFVQHGAARPHGRTGGVGEAKEAGGQRAAAGGRRGELPEGLRPHGARRAQRRQQQQQRPDRRHVALPSPPRRGCGFGPASGRGRAAPGPSRLWGDERRG